VFNLKPGQSPFVVINADPSDSWRGWVIGRLPTSAGKELLTLFDAQAKRICQALHRVRMGPPERSRKFYLPQGAYRARIATVSPRRANTTGLPIRGG